MFTLSESMWVIDSALDKVYAGQAVAENGDGTRNSRREGGLGMGQCSQQASKFSTCDGIGFTSTLGTDCVSFWICRLVSAVESSTKEVTRGRRI
jgi:hypothetical protein